MRKQFIGSMLVGSLTALGFSFIQGPVRAADNTTTIDIILDENGIPVFKQPDVSMNEGQTIKWMPDTEKIPHHLFEGPTKDDDNVETTREFNRHSLESATPLESAASLFKKGKVVHYHCQIHRGSMQGTITVK